MTCNSKFCKISEVYKQKKNFQLLKITEIYELELGKLMCKIHNSLIPTAVKEKFIPFISEHNHIYLNRRLKERKLLVLGLFASC